MTTPPTSSSGAQSAGDEHIGGDPGKDMTTPTPAASTPPVKSSEEYFNSSRLKVIGMITAATVAVGALGGIAGVVFDPDPVSTEPRIQPGGDNGTLGSPGNAAPHRASLPPLDLSGFAAAGNLPRADATESPTSVGSVSPGSGGFTSSPSDEPTDVTGEPTPTDGGDTGDPGSGSTISATGVAVYVPPGWEVTFQDDHNVGQTDGGGSYAFAYSTTVDPSTAAGDVIAENLDLFLPPESYTQRQTSDIVPLQPFGSVVSLSALGYEALWVDNQGSVSLHGEMYVGVRQDGTLLVMLIEHLPAEDFESAYGDLAPIVDNTFSRFGGLG